MARTSSTALIGALNPEQREAVVTTEGPLLVLAGAGTGKTRVVTTRIAHLLLGCDVAPRNVLAVTFTNKAALEMRDRVASLVGPRAKGLTVSTFHSFAIRMLRTHAERLGYRSNFTIADDEDRLTLLRSALRELGIREDVVAPRWGLYQISLWKNEGLTPDAAHERATEEREVLLVHGYERLAEEMKRRQTIDFDDMILLAGRLLRDDPEVLQESRDRFRYLMVDEYQDTNASQYDIVRALAGARRNLCVVGDDDQSIYGWRGARAGNILEFTRTFPEAKVVTLERNYRSTNNILRAANAVVVNNIGRRDKRLWSALGDGEPVRLYTAEDERDELLWVASEIGRLRGTGVAWEDIAILFRANAQSVPIETCLRERSIPYRIIGTRSLFDRREVRDALAYLKVLSNPRDDTSLLRVINTPTRGIGRSTQDRLMAEAVEKRVGIFELLLSGEGGHSLGAAARQSVDAFREIMREVAQHIDDHGVRGGLEHLLERIAYKAYLEMDNRERGDAQLRWNILKDVVALAGRYDEKGGDEGLPGFLDLLALDRPGDGKDDGQGLTVMTVHSAKGLEFDRVFIVGAEEGLMPHKNSLEDDEGLDTIDEERRLFYVALTRAKRTLTLTMAGKRRRYGREEVRFESRFVEEIGDDLIDRIDAHSQAPADEDTSEDYLSKLKGMFGGAE